MAMHHRRKAVSRLDYDATMFVTVALVPTMEELSWRRIGSIDRQRDVTAVY
jgi:hypothetical protein